MWGQVTRSGQVTQLQNNFLIAPRLQCFRESYGTFGIMMRSSVPTKRISWIFYIGDLRSGHFCDLPIISQWAKNQLLYLLWRKRFWVESYRIGQLWTIRVKNCITYPSKGHLRSPEVTNRHLPITFDQKEIETWDWCQYVRLGQANRVICNMTHSGHHVTLAWLDLRSNFDLDLSEFISYMVRRALTRQTQWYQIRCSIFKIKDFIVEKPFGKFLNFYPWRPQFWPEPKNDRNDFEMIFRELSNGAFRFSLRRPGAEIMGGGGVQTPPPPSRRWKIQRPSRAPEGAVSQSLGWFYQKCMKRWK